MIRKLFKWKHFEMEIILLCVRGYLKYPLSYRDLVDMMAERGIILTHTTIMRWAGRKLLLLLAGATEVHQYSPILDEKIRRHLKKTNDSWRLDETYIKIKGKNAYLYRAVDSEGNTIDFYVSENRDKDAAKKFIRKALNSQHNQQPRVITTDKYAATEAGRSLRELLANAALMAILEEQYYGALSCCTEHRMTKYLNNIVEQDHRFIKRKVKPMLGFKTYKSASETICGTEIFHMIKKGQVENIQCVLSEVEMINNLMSNIL